jgi:hypothetical protein
MSLTQDKSVTRKLVASLINIRKHEVVTPACVEAGAQQNPSLALIPTADFHNALPHIIIGTPLLPFLLHLFSHTTYP